MSVSVVGVGISASCPGTTPVGVNATIQGQVSFTLVNDGGEEAFVDLVIELFDSAGHRVDRSETFRRVAPGSEREDQTLFLNASYEQAAHIAVTMRLRVGGAASGTFFAECDFFVQ